MFKHLLVPTDGSDLSRLAAAKAIAFAGETGARLTFFVALPQHPVSFHEGYGLTDAGTRARLIATAEQQGRAILDPLVAADRNRFYAGVPLRLASGERLGALCVLDHRPRRLEPEQLEMLELLGRHVSRLLDERITAAQQGEALIASDIRDKLPAARMMVREKQK